MKTNTSIQTLLLLVIVLASIVKVSGQIQIVSGNQVSPEYLVQKMAGQGIQVENVTFQGADISRGIFENGDSTNLYMESGVFFTTGAASLIPGPNTSTNAGQNNNMPGHSVLEGITISNTHDAAVLEFDFIPHGDTLIVEYRFGSEEYNEMVNVSPADVFGFFISGPKPDGGIYSDQNIALIPGTTIPVNSNNLNNGQTGNGPCEYCEYFANNVGGLTLEYDGFTTKLAAWILVVPQETYHCVIGIADVDDYLYDSGIFIEENSFRITQPALSFELIPDPPGLTDNLVEGHVNAEVIFRLANPVFTAQTLYFNLSGTASNGEDYAEIADSIVFETGMDSAVLTIEPFYDEVIEGDETVQLIVENLFGWFPLYDTLNLVIEDYVALSDTMSPSLLICEGMEVTLWIEAINGYPPYTYLWEPGGYTSDSIIVTPDTNTTYVVTYSDLFGETAQDSVQVTVFPYCELVSFYFEATLNPGLPYDVYGEITTDSIFVDLPPGTDLTALIPTFDFINEVCPDTVMALNDFTNPVVYEFTGPGGCSMQWVVMADIGTGKVKNFENPITLYPNPAKDQLVIQNARGCTLEIFTPTGVPVLQNAMIDHRSVIDVSYLESGIYLLHFVRGEKEMMKRVVIAK